MIINTLPKINNRNRKDLKQNPSVKATSSYRSRISFGADPITVKWLSQVGGWVLSAGKNLFKLFDEKGQSKAIDELAEIVKKPYLHSEEKLIGTLNVLPKINDVCSILPFLNNKNSIIGICENASKDSFLKHISDKEAAKRQVKKDFFTQQLYNGHCYDLSPLSDEHYSGFKKNYIETVLYSDLIEKNSSKPKKEILETAIKSVIDNDDLIYDDFLNQHRKEINKQLEPNNELSKLYFAIKNSNYIHYKEHDQERFIFYKKYLDITNGHTSESLDFCKILIPGQMTSSLSREKRLKIKDLSKGIQEKTDQVSLKSFIKNYNQFEKFVQDIILEKSGIKAQEGFGVTNGIMITGKDDYSRKVVAEMIPKITDLNVKKVVHNPKTPILTLQKIREAAIESEQLFQVSHIRTIIDVENLAELLSNQTDEGINNIGKFNRFAQDCSEKYHVTLLFNAKDDENLEASSIAPHRMGIKLETKL